MNDQLDTTGTEGQGGDLIFTDPHHRRQDLEYLARAANNGWKIKQEYYDAAPAYAASVLADADSTTRERMAAVRALQAMDRNRLSAIALHDRITRLDGGLPTDVVDHNIRLTKSVAARVLTDPAVQAQAQKMHEMLIEGNAA